MGSFSGSIPPYFVLSHNMSTINTTSNWLRFGAFLSLPVPCLRLHWPLTTVYWPLFTCHWPEFSRHSPLPPTTLPRWLLPGTDRRIAKTERGPISTSGPSISLCAEPGDSCAQINPFLPTRRRSPVDRSLVAKALNPSLFRRACRMALRRNDRPCMFDSPKQLGMVSPELPSTTSSLSRTTCPHDSWPGSVAASPGAGRGA